jgi:hypothetical protein
MTVSKNNRSCRQLKFLGKVSCCGTIKEIIEDGLFGYYFISEIWSQTYYLIKMEGRELCRCKNQNSRREMILYREPSSITYSH